MTPAQKEALAAIGRAVADAERGLRAVLMSGGSTGSLRRRLAELGREAENIRESADEAEAVARAADAQTIATRTAEIASTSSGALADALARLQPLPAPSRADRR